MNVLIVAPALPFPLDNGGAVRIYNLLRFLAQRHRVSMLCFASPDHPDAAAAVRQFCHRLEVVDGGPRRRPFWQHARHLFSPMPYSVCMPSRAMEARLNRMLHEDRYDIVQVEFLALAHLARHIPAGRRVIVEHSITSIVRRRMVPLLSGLPKRLYYRWDLLKLAAYETRLLRQFDRCIAVSDHDRDILRALVPGLRVETIPNGVDCDYFSPRPWTDDPTILFVGAFHAEQANVDAALYFCRQIFPLIQREVPLARVVIVGPEPPPEVRALEGRAVTVTGYVEDVRPYIGGANAVVLPLRGGSGTKIRMFCAMAMGRPVVATPMALEGMEVEPGRHCLVADAPEAFARAVVDVLTTPDLRERIGAEARRWVTATSDWRAIGVALEGVYEDLVAHRARGDAPEIRGGVP